MIESIGNFGIATYYITRVSARQGQTPPVDSVDSVESSLGGSEEVSWMEMLTQLSSMGAIVQRLSLLSSPGVGSTRSSQSNSAKEPIRTAVGMEAEERLRIKRQRDEVEIDESQPRRDPLDRIVEAVTEQARSIAQSHGWTTERMALLTEMQSQFRSDLRQAGQAFQQRQMRSDEFLDRIKEVFASLNRSFAGGETVTDIVDELAETVDMEDTLADSPIPPETLRKAFARELENLRMTLPDSESTVEPTRDPAVNLKFEAYLNLRQQQQEAIHSDGYAPQLNAVA